MSQHDAASDRDSTRDDLPDDSTEHVAGRGSRGSSSGPDGADGVDGSVVVAGSSGSGGRLDPRTTSSSRRSTPSSPRNGRPCAGPGPDAPGPYC